MSLSSMPERSALAEPAARAEAPDVETSSEAYAGRFAGAVGAWLLEVQEAATLRMLATHPGATVLDVGGGHGQVAGALVTRGYRVTVFGSAESCRRRIEPLVAAGACAFRTGDLFALPYADRSHDVVLGYRLLPHVTRWRELLGELARVARHAVLIDVPIRRSLNCLAPRLFALKKRVEGNTRSFTLFDEGTVVAVAAAAGLTPRDRHAEFFLPMALHRALGAPGVSRVSERALRAVGATARFGSPVILKLVRGEG